MANEKLLGPNEIEQNGLEWRTRVCWKWEASNYVIPNIPGTRFRGVSIVAGLENVTPEIVAVDCRVSSSLLCCIKVSVLVSLYFCLRSFCIYSLFVSLCPTVRLLAVSSWNIKSKRHFVNWKGETIRDASPQSCFYLQTIIEYRVVVTIRKNIWNMKQNSYVMYECLHMNFVVHTSNFSKLKQRSLYLFWAVELPVCYYFNCPFLKERRQMGDQGVAREAVLKGILDCESPLLVNCSRSGPHQWFLFLAFVNLTSGLHFVWDQCYENLYFGFL